MENQLNMDMSLDSFNSLYDYKYDPDGRDFWRVLKPNEKGVYRGDCEDYSLSVLYYVMCQESWFKFWWRLFTFQVRVRYVLNKGSGHAVLQHGNMYIDNWTKKWVIKERMESLGHRFRGWRFIPTTVAIRMAKAKLRG